MADTRRSITALQTLLADNTTGDISAQDARDVLVSDNGFYAVQSGTEASTPSSGQVEGDLYLPTDGFYAKRFNGTIWEAWGPLSKMTPPVDADFSWVVQGNAVKTTTNGGINLTLPGGNGNMSVLKKSIPATPYTVTMCMMLTWLPSSQPNMGMVLRQSSDGKLVTWVWGYVPGAYLLFRKWNSYNSFTGSDYATISHVEGPLWWFRIADNGTTMTVSISRDGVNFVAFATRGHTDFMTADEIGFGLRNDSSYACSMSVLSWKEE